MDTITQRIQTLCQINSAILKGIEEIAGIRVSAPTHPVRENATALMHTGKDTIMKVLKIIRGYERGLRPDAFTEEAIMIVIADTLELYTKMTNFIEWRHSMEYQGGKPCLPSKPVSIKFNPDWPTLASIARDYQKPSYTTLVKQLNL